MAAFIYAGSLYNLEWPQIYSVTQDGLNLMILLP
jgi:hypothetical protein